MKNVKLGVVLLGLLAAAIAGPAVAQSKDDEKGLLIGGSLGVSQYRTACNNLSPFTCESTDAAYRVFGGYQFNKWFSVEIGYADLGPVTGNDAMGTSFALTNQAFDGVGVVSLPVAGNLSAFGKFGLFSTRTTLVTTTTTGQRVDAGSTNVNYSYGAGLQYNLWKLGFRLEWQRWDNAGKNGPTVEDDIDFFSAGLLFRF